VDKKKKRNPEAKGILTLALCIIVLLALVSYYDGAPSRNWLGLFGYSVALGMVLIYVAIVAQLVRALDCDSRGRGFEPRLSPTFSP
jgi:hypothetical protein